MSPERLQAVAAHYLEFGGVSPINAQNRALRAALEQALRARGTPMPVYWGNRHWYPYLSEVVAQMRDDGIETAAAFVTSAYSSYSGCRQYMDDLAAARAHVGPDAPEVVKLRPFFNHPGFVAPLAEGLRRARAVTGPDAPVLMTAHSIPVAMADTCDYERQLRETARLVADAAGEEPASWSLVYQSRSGPPAQPWLGPDVSDAIAALPAGTESVIVVPVGSVSDHMEVVYDLDHEAAARARARGVRLVRSATPGIDPAFVEMVCLLVDEARDPALGRLALGGMGPAPGPCRPGCCPGPAPRPGAQ